MVDAMVDLKSLTPAIAVVKRLGSTLCVFERQETSDIKIHVGYSMGRFLRLWHMGDFLLTVRALLTVTAMVVTAWGIVYAYSFDGHNMGHF